MGGCSCRLMQPTVCLCVEEGGEWVQLQVESPLLLLLLLSLYRGKESGQLNTIGSVFGPKILIR